MAKHGQFIAPQSSSVKDIFLLNLKILQVQTRKQKQILEYTFSSLGNWWKNKTNGTYREKNHTLYKESSTGCFEKK